MPEHVASIKMYVGVFLTLMVFTRITVWVAYQDLGAWNDIVMLTIAVTKAVLVILFFMHVKYSTRLTALTAISGFFFLAILICMTLNDYLSRFQLLGPLVPGK
ncbi:MAG TPA: cytochrome C oxidase subunit IV family protein [Thermoanaerobaculia bacterium]|nr:cytochrome C oxidase subunit IV family protein [Thermoanaerobaculia bacterium]